MPGKNMFDDEHSAESKNGILIVGQVVGLSIPFLDARHREAKEKIGGEIKYIEPLLETLLYRTDNNREIKDFVYFYKAIFL